MQKIIRPLILFACISIFATRKKEQEDTLAPATQLGANTFGCKINGKVYVPKGNSGTGTPNPHVQYDIGLNGIPYFNIDAIRYQDGFEGEAFLAFPNLNHLGSYPVPNEFNFLLSWKKEIENCSVPAFDTTIQKWGGNYYQA